MKAKVTVLLGCVAILINKASAECSKLPDNFNIAGCCKFPSMADEGIVRKVAESFKDQKLDEFMMECKISEGIFKHFNFTKDDVVDKDAILKHLEKEITDAAWKPVMKSAGTTCINDVTSKKEEIFKEMEKNPFNIKKDQCNPVYMSLITCIHLEGFEHCPKEVWTDEKRCTDSKAWIVECGNKIDSLRELASKTPSENKNI